MTARPRASSAAGGFTIVELLVATVILGLLAAIAVPVLLDQRRQAEQSLLQADLRAVATAMEAHRSEQRAYPATAEALGPVALSTGTRVTVLLHGMPADSYRLHGERPDTPRGVGAWLYESHSGDLRPDDAARPSRGWTVVPAARELVG